MMPRLREMRRVGCFTLGFLLSTTFLLRAQSSPAVQQRPEVEEAFQRGVRLYNAGQFRQADQTFSEINGGAKSAGANRWHQRSSAALYMNASSSFQLGRYAEASAYLQKLLDNFPKSKYVEFAHALAGAIYFNQERFEDAAQQMLWVVNHGSRPDLVNRQAQLARTLAADYLSTEQLQALQKSVAGERGQALLTFQMVRNQASAGDRDAGAKTLEAFKKSFPRSKILEELNALLAASSERPAAVAHVGVVLPLSGEFADEGNRLYQGIKYAFDAFRRDKNHALPIELIVKDSGSNMLQALKHAQTLLQDPSVIALIGELETDISGGLAALAQAGQAPLVVPTPTVNNLTKLGENVFQATADLESKGSFLARYAIEKLAMKTFVTIAPQDEYGRQMTDGFTTEVDRLGGQILAQKWYYDTPEDLSRHFKSIREIAFRRALQDSLVASGKSLADINLNAEWRAYEERFKEERYKDERQRKTKEGIVESTDVPVTNVEAIFLPVYGDEVGAIARQVSYFNIRAQILGGEHWYVPDLDKSRELQRYVSGVIFTTDYFINPEDAQFKQLRADFRLRLGRTPERWEILGIDAGRLVLSAFAAGARDRRQMRERLAATENFAAVRGKIDFSFNQRMNHSINLVQIRQSKLEKLQ